MQALAEANRIRTARSHLKQDIFHGRVTVAEILHDQPWEVERMRVAELLSAQRRWGAAKTRDLLAELRISELRPVGCLTEREVAVLCWHLTPWRAAA